MKPSPNATDSSQRPLGDMGGPRRILHIFMAFALVLGCFSSDDLQGWKNVNGLKGAMYAEMLYSRACVKLLNISGPQGCEAPDQQLVTAPLVHSKDLGIPFEGQRVVVVPAAEADSFLTRFLGDPTLRSRVAGVLVDPTTGRPSHHSTAPKFPSAAFAPYDSPSYVWNPYGTGFNRQWFGIPIYMLTPALANETARRAAYNADNEFKGGRHVARMQLPMYAQGDSATCITDQTCLPVGGYGVWTAVPPLPDTNYSSVPPRNITLLVAQMDSNALFHDLARAAGSSVSGLIASLVALTLIAQSDAPPTYSRQLVFAALPGEGFDYMGSKRMLYEMDLGSKFVQGIKMDLVDQVVEVGPIGSAWDAAANASTFFLHSQRSGGYGSAAALVAAAQAAAAALDPPRVRSQPASASTPGLPPSSLSSFLRVRPSVAGLLLADFDTAFRGPYYQSEFDDSANSTLAMVEAIVDASLLLATTLHSLAAGPDTPPLEPNRTRAALLTAQLGNCLLVDSPGLRCPLATQLMNPDISVSYDGSTSAAISAYPGVLSWVAADPRSSYFKPNLPRFLFNYLGNLTAVPLSNTTNTTTGEGAACDPNQNICKPPYACIGWRYGTKDPAGMGRCRNTTTNYVPAYSTRLVYSLVGSYWRWSVNSSAAAWDSTYGWPTDPMWTESNWPAQTPTLTVFQEESRAVQVATLVVGVLLTAGTAGVSWLGIKIFERHIKIQ
ncbi:hypothetical protein PLESTB_001073200 [Pleodorina starrii]|uniref:Nicastrin n=1 Tax=Pleodorina starrii TaxID=330485 RepID=A0A9W6F4H5_9CHLO|nr:hypothetical protein PLESTB_001073200 [Pleodorina starrii]GLC74975.1 hypothetical protein PLESTF_001578800 [Pleodorina starrii]